MELVRCYWKVEFHPRGHGRWGVDKGEIVWKSGSPGRFGMSGIFKGRRLDREKMCW